jgi:predicted MFS family arabinose efflux permease
MQQVAGPWLVYRLTGSAFVLGLVGFLAAIPAAPVSLIAGPLIDRLPRRTLLIFTQLGLSLPPIGLALLVWSGRVQIWHIVVAEVLRGAFLAIDQPAKQAAIVDMTGKEDVGSAVALWSSGISVTRIVGPAVAGLIIAWAGEGLCFFLNGVSYLAVVVAVLAISLPGSQLSEHQSSLGRSLVDGWKYLIQERLLLVTASLALVSGLFLRPFQTLLPVFARDVLGVGAAGLGFLSAAAGAGAMIGALAAASLRAGWWRPLAVIAGLVLPFVTAGFAFSRSLVLSCGLLLALGGWITAQATVVNSLMLVEVKDEFRGRTMSVFTAAAMGAPRVGGLQAGWLAASLGASLALGLGAVASLIYSALAAWILLRDKLGAHASKVVEPNQ